MSDLDWLLRVSVSKKALINDHHSDLFLLIHITGKVFHKALSLLVLERSSK
jgi:hypothetical protein